MIPGLSDTHKELRGLVREFAAAEIAPHADAWNRDKHVPIETLRRLGELGALGVAVPEEHGGAGLDRTAMCIVVEELARADTGVSTAVAAHAGLAVSPIVGSGTDEQRARWLPDLAGGAALGAYALSEADSGSDAGAMKTVARASEGGFRLNGSKLWITNGGFADLFVVFARDHEAGERGVTAFVTHPGEGFGVGREIPKMGLHTSSTVELSFSDHHVEADRVLGERGEGFKLAMRALDGGRINIAAQACGVATAALELATRYAGERMAFGAPIARFQGVQFPIADIAARLDAARLLTYHAASLADRDAPHGTAGAKAKLVASRLAVEAADVAVQTLGGFGYSAEFGAERLYRDAKITEIYEGTSEIQRLVIARSLFGDAARG